MLKATRHGFTTRRALLCSGAALTQRERGPGSVSSPELHSCREGEMGEPGQQHPAANRTWLQRGRSSSTSRWAHGQGKGKGISDYFKWWLAAEVEGHRSSLILQSHVPLLLQQCWACLSLSYFISNNHLRPICPKYSDLLKGLHFSLFWQRYVLTYFLLLSSPEGHSKNKIKQKVLTRIDQEQGKSSTKMLICYITWLLTSTPKPAYDSGSQNTLIFC